MRIVSLVTPWSGSTSPPLSPENAGTHGGASCAGILSRPVVVSQFGPQLVLFAVPSALAASKVSTGPFATPPPLLLVVDVVFLSSPLTATTTPITIAATATTTMNGK